MLDLFCGKMFNIKISGPNVIYLTNLLTVVALYGVTDIIPAGIFNFERGYAKLLNLGRCIAQLCQSLFGESLFVGDGTRSGIDPVGIGGIQFPADNDRLVSGETYPVSGNVPFDQSELLIDRRLDPFSGWRIPVFRSVNDVIDIEIWRRRVFRDGSIGQERQRQVEPIQ